VEGGSEAISTTSLNRRLFALQEPFWIYTVFRQPRFDHPLMLLLFLHIVCVLFPENTSHGPRLHSCSMAGPQNCFGVVQQQKTKIGKLDQTLPFE